MTVESNVIQIIIKWPLMLFFTALEGVGGADTRRPEPDHVIVPGLSMFSLGLVKVGGSEIADHSVNQIQGLFTRGRVLAVEQQAIVSTRARGEYRGRAGAERGPCHTVSDFFVEDPGALTSASAIAHIKRWLDWSCLARGESRRDCGARSLLHQFR